MSQEHTIASIVLNYNSSDDIEVLLPQLVSQRGIKHKLILVDNASQSNDVEHLKAIFRQAFPDGVITSTDKIPKDCRGGPRACLILNLENHGYSAGNNIGIRLAESFGAEAVLLINPDIRIEDPDYAFKLTAALMRDPKIAIAASRIVGVAGDDQNPLRESSFLEEFAWPLATVFRRLRIGSSFVIPVFGEEPVEVPKVSGCCLMIKMNFLIDTGYLDENVFLYCEEPILAAKAKDENRTVLYNPAAVAIHAHEASAKGRVAKRMHYYIESRRYYLQKYSRYNRFQTSAIRMSYKALSLLYRIRDRLKT